MTEYLNKPCPVCKKKEVASEYLEIGKIKYYRLKCYQSCRKGRWCKSTLRALKAWNDRKYSISDDPFRDIELRKRL